MPILLPHPITALSEQAFHKLDYEVMALAFETHNALGRFYDEVIYQNELREKCQNKGLNVQSELEVRLIHQGYTKPLFIDLLIENSVYELKVIKAIQEQQRIQTLDYLFCTDTQHGKIINFRPSSVEHEFVSTTLSEGIRKRFSVQSNQWRVFSPKAEQLKHLTLELLSDWGAFFDTHIYEDALIHLLGGKEHIVKSVEIRNSNQLLGMHKFNQLSESEIFMITAARNNINQYSNHLGKLIRHTPFEHLYWINLKHSIIQFTTLG